MFYFTEDLVNAIKLSSFAPTGQATFNDPTDFIFLANEEFQKKLVPHIVKVRQDFFVKHLTTPLVDKINHYPLPERTVGNTLVDLFYLPSTSDLSQKKPIPKINIHDQQLFQSSSTSEVNKCYIEGDEIITVPTPSNPTGNLLYYFLRKPSKIVPTSQCGKITARSVSGPNTVFTVDTDLTSSSLTTVLSAGSLIDFMQVKSPFICRDIDVAIGTITTTQITVPTASVQDEASRYDPGTNIGDYICPAQQSNIPQCPDIFHPIISEMVVCRILRTLGHLDKLQVAKAELVDALRDTWGLIENRIESEVDVMYDQSSLLNQVNSWTAWPYSSVK